MYGVISLPGATSFDKRFYRGLTTFRFGTKLYRQVVGIPIDTNYAPLVADLFLFCYEREFMMSLPDDKQAVVIDAFYTTSTGYI